MSLGDGGTSLIEGDSGLDLEGFGGRHFEGDPGFVTPDDTGV